jgi:hypothetical protein
MKAKVKLTPTQKKVIEYKLKQARQKRIVKGILYNPSLNSESKLNLITNYLKTN